MRVPRVLRCQPDAAVLSAPGTAVGGPGGPPGLAAPGPPSPLRVRRAGCVWGMVRVVMGTVVKRTKGWRKKMRVG